MLHELHKISPLDLAWLFVESDATPMHVGSLMVFGPADQDGRAGITRLYDELLRQPAETAPFNLRMHRQGLQLPQWEEVDDVDLDYHVQRWALPGPGGDQELNELVGRLHSEALDTSKPLWEFHLIEGLTDDRVAVYIKVHHSIMDGIAGLSLMRSMMTTDPKTPCAAPWARDSAIARLSVVNHDQHPAKTSLLQRFRQLGDQLRHLPDVSNSLRELAWAALHQTHSDLQAPYTAPPSALNSRIGHERHFATTAISLNDAQSIAAHAGVTINDVLLASCGGGLRAYQAHIGDHADDSLLAGLPISLREAGDVHVGTAVSFLIATLATCETDPRERLARIHASTRAAKAHLRGMPSEALTQYTLLLMAPYMGELLSGLAGRIKPAFNVIISNVPGPDEALYFHGAPLLGVYPLSIVTHGQALNITIVGYQNQLQFGLTTAAPIGDPDALAREIEAEFARLQAWSHHH